MGLWSYSTRRKSVLRSTILAAERDIPLQYGLFGGWRAAHEAADFRCVYRESRGVPVLRLVPKRKAGFIG
jgi:hypothetical protein